MKAVLLDSVGMRLSEVKVTEVTSTSLVLKETTFHRVHQADGMTSWHSDTGLVFPFKLPREFGLVMHRGNVVLFTSDDNKRELTARRFQGYWLMESNLIRAAIHHRQRGTHPLKEVVKKRNEKTEPIEDDKQSDDELAYLQDEETDGESEGETAKDAEDEEDEDEEDEGEDEDEEEDEDDEEEVCIKNNKLITK